MYGEKEAIKPGTVLTARRISKMIDHSLLLPDITVQDIIDGCEIAIKYDCATVSTNPSVIPIARDVLKGSDVRYGTIISFPNGYESTANKMYCAEAAIEQGCTEIDLIMNIQRLKSKNYEYVANEISSVAKITRPANVLFKVLLETNFLTDEEVKVASKVIGEAGADYIKANSGFPGKASIHHLKLMREAAPAHVRIKAAGGIRTLDNFLAAISIGVTKLGATSTVPIVSEAREREKSGEIVVPFDVPEDLY